MSGENQRSDLINQFDENDDEFDLYFSFDDDLFTDEKGIKEDVVIVEVLDCAVSHESVDLSFDSLVGDWSRNTDNVCLTSSSEQAKHMSKRKTESEDGLVGQAIEDEKRKAKLIRNRESAQMWRERKKRYAEELDNKIRAMHATITSLNCKYAYVMAENASLRRQIGAGMISPLVPGGASYPWIPSLPCNHKSVKSKKSNSNESGNKITEAKTKRVASISLFGLLVFVFLFGGLVPILNTKYRGVATSQHHVTKRHVSSFKSATEESKRDSGKSGEDGNLSQSLVASLYVPRDDKLVKIDGCLIIPSVLAREEAVSSEMRKNRNRQQSYMYRDGNKRLNKLAESSKSSADDTQHHWFSEGAAGRKLSSGLCTEVFQFDISPGVNNVPASLTKNISTDHQSNSTQFSNVANKTENEEHIKSNYTNKSAMVVSVHIDPKEDSDMEEGSVTRIFVVVLLERVRYVTYSCVLPVKG